jgi:hypothetical protein
LVFMKKFIKKFENFLNIILYIILTIFVSFGFSISYSVFMSRNYSLIRQCNKIISIYFVFLIITIINISYWIFRFYYKV